MSDIPPHNFYLGGSDKEFAEGEQKGGETGDIYARISGYGTSYLPNNPFRYRFVVTVPIKDIKVVHAIEALWLSKFENIVSLEDKDDLNHASTVEAIRFNDKSEFLLKFKETLGQLRLNHLPIEVYDTNDKINALLKFYHNRHISRTRVASISGQNLRPYQEEDITNTIFEFRVKRLSRGFWSIECGLGKTLMAFELIGRMDLRKTFFVVPRNTLLHQALRNFITWNYPMKRLFVCNGTKMPEDLDKVQRVKRYSQLPTDTQWICITTYDSLPNMHGANVDMTIFDEAHHLVPSGKKTDLSGNLFGLDSDNIRSTYRLSLTGTPKDTPLMDNDVLTHIGFSHQPHLYGICMAERNYIFGRDSGYLAPFEVVCIKTEPTRIRRLIDNLRKQLGLKRVTFKDFLKELSMWEEGRSRYITDYVEKTTIDPDNPDEPIISGELILWYAIVADLLIQAIQSFGSRKIVTYHTTKKRAELFKRVFGIVWGLKKIEMTISCETVHSGNTEDINEKTKADFKAIEGPDVRILCNIRTLVEGFDEPSIDTTVFVDNKWSAIETKQIVGRGNRKDPRNNGKLHRVLIPFLSYEMAVSEDTIQIRTTNDYKTVRYTIKNIILSSDPNQSIAQTVWVPKAKVVTEGDSDDDDNDEGDGLTVENVNERVWLAEELPILHDEKILGSCPTRDLAEQAFHAARLWMHRLADSLNWNQHCKTESQLTHTWNQYRDTHVLPKGIPYDPSRVYKQVGWINMRDYTGILTTRTEWPDMQAGEFMELIRSMDINVFDYTLSSLRSLVEKHATRKLPQQPYAKWKMSVYEIANKVNPGSAKGVKGWGKYPDRVYSILQLENVSDALDFERLWPSLHTKYPDLPGIPTELWNDTFWARYEPCD
jgi:superfamily II DNA or RNA helicase